MPSPVLPLHRGLSGDIIVQFKEVKPLNLGVLQARVESAPDLPPAAEVEVRRVITSLSEGEVNALEAGLPPGTTPISLNALFRVGSRSLGLDLASLEALRAWLAADPRVAVAYLELAVSLASQLWWERSFAPDQAHLLDAPDGVGARTFWARPGGAGHRAHLYAVEHGWALDHGDLQGRAVPPPLTGDNAARLPVKDGPALRRINHGTSALTTAVGCDDAPGRIGVAPAVAGVWVCSAYDAARDEGEHIASAILAAIQHRVQAGPAGAVLMLQVQRGFGLPVEVDLADFLAIRLAVLRGLAVIEPAGNGGCDLGVAGWPDSGATLVGAMDPSTQAPLPGSNRGARVDGFGSGRVATSGAPLDGQGLPDRTAGPISALRRDDFGRTSAATAVIAGAALCLIGRALALGHSPGALDVRAWLKASGQGGLVDLSAIADGQLTPSGARLSPLRIKPGTWPWRGALGAASALTVSNPQTGEGNTNLVATDPTGASPDINIGFVRLPPLPGAGLPHAVPAGSPPGTGPNDPPWVEHWVLTSAEALTSPPDLVRLCYDAGDSTSNPNGQIWGAEVIQYFKSRPDYNTSWRTIPFSFKYTPVPAAPQPALDDAGWTLLHFEIHRSAPGGPVKVGELRRRVQGDRVQDRWALYGNYRFAEPGADVRLSRVSAGQSTWSWLADVYAASLGSATPRPQWFVLTEGDLTPL